MALSSDSSVVNNLAAEPGRTPLYVGLLSLWGSEDSEQMFCLFLWEGSLIGDSDNMNERINHWLWRRNMYPKGPCWGTWREAGLLGTLRER